MLPYFIYTEDIEKFCQLTSFTICTTVSYGKRACMYSLNYNDAPYITRYCLDYETDPLIPPEKVLEYLALMLNGYSKEIAVNELNVVG